MNEHGIDDEPVDPTIYGAAFADVYDRWYSQVSPIEPLVDALDRRCAGAPGRLLELGIGTGRLALPLVEAGWIVSGIDASVAMVDQLAAKAGGTAIEVTVGDVADPSAWPDQRYDVVLAAFNLIFNIAEDRAQRRVLGLVAAHLSPGGELAVEADVLDLGDQPSEASASSVVEGVHIETTSDPTTGVIHGVHRGSGRDRPWRLRYLSPAQLDAMAAEAGLELVDRWESWRGDRFVEGYSDQHVSFYRLIPAGSV